MSIRCTIEDIDRVQAVLLHPEVYPFIGDDFAPAPEDTRRMRELMLNAPFVYFLMPNEQSVFTFQPINAVTYLGHMAIVPEGRGRKGFLAGRQALDWMFTNTGVLKIEGRTPTDNWAAIRFAASLGFKVEGVAKACRMTDGILQNEVLTGLTKKEWSNGR